MKRLLVEVFTIAKKDLVEFSRDRLRLISFFIMPFFMMLMVGFIFPNQITLKRVPAGIVNLDNGTHSKELVNFLKGARNRDGSPLFVLKEYDGLKELKDAIMSDEVSGGIVIEENFSREIDGNQQGEVKIIIDQANPQFSQQFSQIAGEIINLYSKKLAVKKISIYLNRPEETVVKTVEPVKSKVRGLVSENYNYFEFVAPGIIAMIVMTAVLTGLAAAISREREMGTLDGILVSPVNRLSIVLGKACAQAVRGIFQGLTVLFLSVLLFGVKINGSILLVLAILILGIFSFVGFGILVSASAAEQETATQLLFMFQFPMLFLSGVFFPVSMMPEFMQSISKIIPLTYAIEALRKVMVLGASPGAVKGEITVLFLTGIVATAISIPLFKKMITR